MTEAMSMEVRGVCPGGERISLTGRILVAWVIGAVLGYVESWLFKPLLRHLSGGGGHGVLDTIAASILPYPVVAFLSILASLAVQWVLLRRWQRGIECGEQPGILRWGTSALVAIAVVLFLVASVHVIASPKPTPTEIPTGWWITPGATALFGMLGFASTLFLYVLWMWWCDLLAWNKRSVLAAAALCVVWLSRGTLPWLTVIAAEKDLLASSLDPSCSIEVAVLGRWHAVLHWISPWFCVLNILFALVSVAVALAVYYYGLVLPRRRRALTQEATCGLAVVQQ